jgi:hypothetical protein
MIGMLVRNQDAVDVLGACAAEGFETPQHFLAAEANVNQESRLPAFEQRGVARTTRREDGNAKRNTTLSVCRCCIKLARSDGKDDCKLERQRQQNGSKSKLGRSELEAVEIADDGGREAFGLE